MKKEFFMFLVQLIILLLSLTGIGLTLYTFSKRKENEKQVLVDAKSDPIIQIKHSRFLEAPVELLVAGCFGMVAVLFAILLISGMAIPELELAVLALVGMIFLLMIYEMTMKLAAFGEFCMWCLITILLSGGVFGLIIVDLDFAFVPKLREAYNVLLTFHVWGVVLGLGGTTLTDLMFFNFLKNYQVSKKEAGIMHLISQLIILGICVLLITGLLLFLSDMEKFLDSDVFLMKMVTVAAVILNGALLNLYVTPKLKDISFAGKPEIGKNETLKHIAFALGAISIISWYSAFVLAMLDALSELSFTTLFVSYLVLLLLGIGGSQFAKILFEKKAKDELYL